MAEKKAEPKVNDLGDKQVGTEDGIPVWANPKGHEYIMSPNQDSLVRLHYTQGHNANLIARELGLPFDKVTLVIKRAAADMRAKHIPLPKQLGRKGANDTPAAEVA